MLAWLGPESDAQFAEVPVAKPDRMKLPVEDGIVAYSSCWLVMGNAPSSVITLLSLQPEFDHLQVIATSNPDPEVPVHLWHQPSLVAGLPRYVSLPKSDFELLQFDVVAALVEKVWEGGLGGVRQNPAKRRLDGWRGSLRAHRQMSEIRCVGTHLDGW